MSDEIERIREELKRITHAQTHTSTNASYKDVTSHITSDAPQKQEASHNVEAVWEIKNSCTSSFSSRARHIELQPISWHDCNHNAGTEYVPQIVAKAFGKQPRYFNDVQQFKAYLDDLIQRSAFTRIVTFLESKERSTQEVTQRLVRDGFANDVIRDAIQRAHKISLLDDTRFAHAFIRSKTFQGWGKLQIERSLRSAGVDVTTLDGYPDDYYEQDDEYTRALMLLTKKRPANKNPQQKFVRYLINKGYSYDIAYAAALERMSQEIDDE